MQKRTEVALDRWRWRITYYSSIRAPDHSVPRTPHSRTCDRSRTGPLCA